MGIDKNVSKDSLLHSIGEIEFEKEAAKVHQAELSSMSWSFDLSIDAFLFDPRNFTAVDISVLTVPHPRELSDGETIREVILVGFKEFFSKWENRGLVALFLLFITLLFMIKADVVRVQKFIDLLPTEQETPPPTPKPTPPPPKPTPPPTPPPPTPPPLKPLKLNKTLDNKLNVKVNVKRELKQISNVHAKLYTRDVAADNETPDIANVFTTADRDKAVSNVSLDKIGSGRRGGDAGDGAPAIGNIGGGRGRGTGTDAGVRVSLGKVSRDTKGDVQTDASGRWQKVAIAGPIAGLQVRCLNNPGFHVYGNIRIQCQNNVIVAAWKRM